MWWMMKFGGSGLVKAMMEEEIRSNCVRSMDGSLAGKRRRAV